MEFYVEFDFFFLIINNLKEWNAIYGFTPFRRRESLTPNEFNTTDGIVDDQKTIADA